MSIHEYSQPYEEAHYAICERVQHAKIKHPEDIDLIKRLHTVMEECGEVWAELMIGDYERAMDEAKDVGATLYRLFEELSRKTGVSIR